MKVQESHLELIKEAQSSVKEMQIQANTVIGFASYIIKKHYNCNIDDIDLDTGEIKNLDKADLKVEK